MESSVFWCWSSLFSCDAMLTREELQLKVIFSAFMSEGKTIHYLFGIVTECEATRLITIFLKWISVVQTIQKKTREESSKRTVSVKAGWRVVLNFDSDAVCRVIHHALWVGSAIVWLPTTANFGGTRAEEKREHVHYLWRILCKWCKEVTEVRECLERERSRCLTLSV